ncbi:MAG: hypothetical protein ACRD1N_04835, partial [Terriglobia bacterium]
NMALSPAIAQNVLLDCAAVEALIEKTLDTVFTRYIDPFSVSDKVVDLSLVVGMVNPEATHPEDALGLFSTDLRTANAEAVYAVGGTGGEIARFIIETLQGLGNTRQEAKLITAYALSVAKGHDIYSGKETRIKTILPDSGIETVGADELLDLEEYFRASFQSFQIALSLAYDDTVDDALLESMASFKDAVIQLRRREEERRERLSKLRNLREKVKLGSGSTSP